MTSFSAQDLAVQCQNLSAKKCLQVCYDTVVSHLQKARIQSAACAVAIERTCSYLRSEETLGRFGPGTTEQWIVCLEEEHGINSIRKQITAGLRYRNAMAAAEATIMAHWHIPLHDVFIHDSFTKSISLSLAKSLGRLAKILPLTQARTEIKSAITLRIENTGSTLNHACPRDITNILSRLREEKGGHENRVEDMEDQDLEEKCQSLEDEDVEEECQSLENEAGENEGHRLEVGDLEWEGQRLEDENLNERGQRLEVEDLEEGQSFDNEHLDPRDSDQDEEPSPVNHAATKITQRKRKHKASHHLYQPSKKNVNRNSTPVPPIEVARRAPSSLPFGTPSDDRIGESTSTSPIDPHDSSPLSPIGAANISASPVSFIPDVHDTIDAGFPTAQRRGLHQSGTRGSVAVAKGGNLVGDALLPGKSETSLGSDCCILDDRNKVAPQPATSSLDCVPNNTVEGAQTSLAPGKMLSTTAIQLILHMIADGIGYCYDPSYFNADEPRKISVPNRAPDARLLILPLNRRRHWTVALFDREDHSIGYYDPLHGRTGAASEMSLLLKHWNQIDEGNEWTSKHISGPQQPNHEDCGIYVLVTIFYIAAQRVPPRDLDGDLWRYIFRDSLRGTSDRQSIRTLVVARSKLDEEVTVSVPTSSTSVRETICISVSSIAHSVGQCRQQLSTARAIHVERTSIVDLITHIHQCAVTTAASARQSHDCDVEEYDKHTVIMRQYNALGTMRQENIWRLMQAESAKVERRIKVEKARAEDCEKRERQLATGLSTARTALSQWGLIVQDRESCLKSAMQELTGLKIDLKEQLERLDGIDLTDLVAIT